MSPGIEYVLIDHLSFFTYRYLYRKKVKVNIKCLSRKNILNSEDLDDSDSCHQQVYFAWMKWDSALWDYSVMWYIDELKVTNWVSRNLDPRCIEVENELLSDANAVMF